MVSSFENNLGSGNILSSALSGGLVASLASKFGLPASVTGAIAAALPGAYAEGSPSKYGDKQRRSLVRWIIIKNSGMGI